MNRFDLLAKTWDEKPRRVENAKKIGEAILKKVAPSGDWRVLDFGAGSGLLTFYLQPHVGWIDAVDNSKGMVEVLKEKVQKTGVKNVNPILGDIESLDLGGERYDLIVSSMTLHHIRDPKRLFEKLFKSLKRGGYIAIADLQKEDGTFHDTNEGVYHFGFHKEELEKFLRGAGFEVLEISVVNVIRKNGREYPVLLAIGRKPFT